MGAVAGAGVTGGAIGARTTHQDVPPSLKSIETFPSGLSYVPREAAVRP